MFKCLSCLKCLFRNGIRSKTPTISPFARGRVEISVPLLTKEGLGEVAVIQFHPHLERSERSSQVRSNKVKTGLSAGGGYSFASTATVIPDSNSPLETIASKIPVSFVAVNSISDSLNLNPCFLRPSETSLAVTAA